MKVKIGTEVAHIPEKYYINGIFVAVYISSYFDVFLIIRTYLFTNMEDNFL
jgi:hypothetical protein